MVSHDSTEFGLKVEKQDSTVAGKKVVFLPTKVSGCLLPARMCIQALPKAPRKCPGSRLRAFCSLPEEYAETSKPGWLVGRTNKNTRNAKQPVLNVCLIWIMTSLFLFDCFWNFTSHTRSRVQEIGGLWCEWLQTNRPSSNGATVNWTVPSNPAQSKRSCMCVGSKCEWTWMNRTKKRPLLLNMAMQLNLALYT